MVLRLGVACCSEGLQQFPTGIQTLFGSERVTDRIAAPVLNNLFPGGSVGVGKPNTGPVSLRTRRTERMLRPLTTDTD